MKLIRISKVAALYLEWFVRRKRVSGPYRSRTRWHWSRKYRRRGGRSRNTNWSRWDKYRDRCRGYLMKLKLLIWIPWWVALLVHHLILVATGSWFVWRVTSCQTPWVSKNRLPMVTSTSRAVQQKGTITTASRPPPNPTWCTIQHKNWAGTCQQRHTKVVPIGSRAHRNGTRPRWLTIDQDTPWLSRKVCESSRTKSYRTRRVLIHLSAIKITRVSI